MDNQVKETKSIKWLVISIVTVVLILVTGTFAWLNYTSQKTAIDSWYQTNMTTVTSKLEDTPFCNDRTIYDLGGWNPNGGSTTSYLYLGAYGRTAVSPYTPSLSCNTNDAFTLPGNASGNGRLTYPVGLLTADEIVMAGETFVSIMPIIIYIPILIYHGTWDHLVIFIGIQEQPNLL